MRSALIVLVTCFYLVPPAGAQEDRSWLGLLGGASRTAETGEEQGTQLPKSRAEIELSFAPLAKATAPAVVNVYAARQVQTQSPFAGDPFFEQFFRRRFERQPRIESSLGSGVIVDPSGLVVTNNHVIEGADEVRVALADGREFRSTILTRDARIDLAVLRIEEAGESFPTVPIADSDAAEIGDLVLAIGNPFGIGQTVTSGIVSALARSHVGVRDFGFFIQTDAAINPGNSGGALIDMRGQLVGVNTAIFSRSGGSMGIGFAIPSNMVRAFVEAAERGGRFERPYLGAEFAPVTADIAEALGMDRPQGALVASVRDGAPAADAGLRPGDVVLSLDGFALDGPDALGYRLATAGLGRPATLAILSQDEEKTISIELAPPPETPARDVRRLSGATPFAGASVANLSPRLADELEMPQSVSGVVVTAVEPGSSAARFGLRERDIVAVLNGWDVASSAELEERLARGGRGWHYEVERDGQRLSQTVR